MNPTISVIVPVYNVSEYVARCIDSILCQTYKDYEIILADDGSKDNSGEICDGYAAKYDNISIVHKQNGGLSSARNAGLDIAKGDYVYFVDSDDEIYENSLEVLITRMTDGIDMVTGGYVKCNPQGDVISDVYEMIDHTFTMSKFAVLLSKPIYFEANSIACIHLFKRSIIEEYHLRFNEKILFCEDTPFIAEYLGRCKGNMIFTTIPIYKYYIRETSLVGSAFNTYKETTFNILDSKLSVYNSIKKFNLSKAALQAAAIKAYDTYKSMCDYADLYGKKGKKEVIKSKLIDTISYHKYVFILMRNSIREIYYKLKK